MRILFSFLLFTFYFASTAQIPSYVPTNGLVGWWPFNGNANDESGNGNNGTVNGASLTSDRFGNGGKALSFDGLSNYVEVPHSSTFNSTNKITISLWIKPTTIFAPGVESYVLNKQSNYGASQVGFHIYYWYNSSLGSMITFRCRNGNNSNWGGCSYNSLSPFTNEWKNDYALLNTDKWRPPINSGIYKCKTEKICPVCPTLTTGYPTLVKDFDIARKILPPDLINVDYINEKLLTGLA